ncbi:adenylate kinase [Fusobacterium sp.]|uniref:adenylate kinase n=1 Tax=Fusobacterium sp. TaxID=68766 RepID=UPI0029051F97|nr:adenylate kinase [Fusobacterium sp.]MDU1910309.1 adenylate kinase [Fusobacterium sp.]
MIILIAGSSHTGKTLMAQKLLEKYNFPYLSIDHLKMGLIRSGNTTLTPNDDNELTGYLWPIVREMIKTAVENRQNLIVEGCYIPFDWKKDFEEEYLEHMRYFCLIMTEEYIKKNFSKIKGYANIIEKRFEDSLCIKEMMIEENIKNFEMCQKYDCDYILIDDEYMIEI